MRPSVSRGVVVLCAVALVGCTSMRTVVDTSAAAGGSTSAPADQLLKPKDSVQLTLRDGSTVQLEVSAVGSDFVEGTLAANQELKRYPLADLSKVERKETSWWKTGALTYIVLAPLIAFLVLKSAFANVLNGAGK